MNIKEFLKPTIWKIIIFVLIILIFGIPATSHSCSTYPLMPGEIQPPCIDSFGFYNLLTILIESTMIAMDAYIKFSFNYLILFSYLIVVYLISCLIILIYKKLKNKNDKIHSKKR